MLFQQIFQIRNCFTNAIGIAELVKNKTALQLEKKRLFLLIHLISCKLMYFYELLNTVSNSYPVIGIQTMP